jgi:hypothetical protein
MNIADFTVIRKLLSIYMLLNDINKGRLKSPNARDLPHCDDDVAALHQRACGKTTQELGFVSGLSPANTAGLLQSLLLCECAAIRFICVACVTR